MSKAPIAITAGIHPDNIPKARHIEKRDKDQGAHVTNNSTIFTSSELHSRKRSSNLCPRNCMSARKSVTVARITLLAAGFLRSSNQRGQAKASNAPSHEDVFFAQVFAFNIIPSTLAASSNRSMLRYDVASARWVLSKRESFSAKVIFPTILATFSNNAIALFNCPSSE